MQSLSASDPNWDALIVGDGSGTGWNEPCGWAAVLFDRHLGRHKKVRGAMDCGTSYLAELMPYVHALSWYLDGPGHGRHLLHEKRKHRPDAVLKVHILTDNQAVARQGRDEIGGKTGSYYRAMFEDFAQIGLQIAWHHRKRLTTNMNKLCDYIAGQQREITKALNNEE